MGYEHGRQWAFSYRDTKESSCDNIGAIPCERVSVSKYSLHDRLRLVLPIAGNGSEAFNLNVSHPGLGSQASYSIYVVHNDLCFLYACQVILSF